MSSVATATAAPYDPSPLQTALQILASRCNYARNLDGAGFSKFDADFGHSLAQKPASEWTPKMTAAAYKMARKYRGQLAEAGHPFEAIPEPPPVDPVDPVTQKPRPAKRISYDGQQFVVEFHYHPELVAGIKKIPGVRFQRAPVVGWTLAPGPNVPGLLRGFAERNGFDIHESAITALARAVPTEVKQLRKLRLHSIDAEALAIEFPFDSVVAADVKRFGVWEKDARRWKVPVVRREALEEFREFLARHHFTIDDGVEARIEQVLAEREALMAESQAESAEPFEIPGLVRQPFPFQWAGIRYALKRKRVFIADQMGLGKTIQAICTVLAANAFPCVVITPASLKINWKREFKLAAPHLAVEVIDGMTPRRWAGKLLGGVPDVFVVNYDILGPHVAGLREVGIRSVVLDEAHYIKNGKTLRGKAVESLVCTDEHYRKIVEGKTRPGEVAGPLQPGLEFVLFLTGTPILNRPGELKYPLKLMRRLQEFGGSRYFDTRYCGASSGYGGGATGADNLGELNDVLRANCYIRRLKADVLKELPPKTRTPITLTIDNRKEYEDTERDFVIWVRDRAARQEKFREALEARLRVHREMAISSGRLTVAEADAEVADLRKQAIREHQDSAEERALRAEVLVRMGVLEQCAVKGKLKGAISWIRDFLESGEKLVLFCTHRDPVKTIAAEFDAPTITGDDTGDQRQAAVERFQTDPDCRLIVCNLQAGGVGLTLTAASNVAFLEMGWTPAEHDQAEDRCHRIGQTDTVTAWYLLGEGTIDEYKAAKLDQKRAIVDAATEGGSAPKVSVFADVLEMLAGRGRELMDTQDNEAQMAEAMAAR